jgi:uncharacterized LabA/DUF88 family protein
VSSFTGQSKDKQLDCAIIVDVAENIAKSNFQKYKNGCNIIVIFAGDHDMAPAVEKVIRQEGIWKVEVYGLDVSISRDLKDLAFKHPDIVTFTILDVKEFTFLEPNWRSATNFSN